VSTRSALARRRRSSELALGLLAAGITVAGYVLVALSETSDLPSDLGTLCVGILGVFAVAHVAVRRLAPRADATFLPLAVLLNGFGFFVITRLDRDRTAGVDALAPVQAVWTVVGVGAFVLTLLVVRRVHALQRYRYSFLLLGVIALLLPLAPRIGEEVNGARLWVNIGPLNFQPGEAAKVLLVVFFAAYLVEKRELLSTGSRRIGRLFLPDPKHLGPLLLAWGLSIVVMVMQKDLGSSLLFFALFAAMLYMATERAAYLLAALVLFVGGAAIAYQFFSHVQARVSTWVDPWPVADGDGYQLVQSLFSFGTGGFAGTGLGLGSPHKIPNASTDFVFAAIGEELGLLGTVAVLAAFMLLIGSGFRTAIQAERPFSKLFAGGLTVIIGVQTFVIVGGVVRLIPLTGVTLPFISYGGSSLVANFVILALLLRISDETAAEAETARPAPRHARRRDRATVR
jgi:peptidoglycan glycosyltransferase